MSAKKKVKAFAFNLFTKVAENNGYDVTRSFINSLPNDIRETIDEVREYTMTSDQRLAALCDAVDYIQRRNIPGDIVECGVWRGGSSMAIAHSLLKTGSTERDIYMYDTYEGMSEPTEFDREREGNASASDLLATSTKDSTVWAYSTLDEVKKNVARIKYPAEKIHFVQGKVEDTIPGVIPKSIALLRLDTDWYESTKHELEHLFPLLSEGGVLVIDDYGHWDGARKAVDEYFEGSKYAPLLYRIDYSGRMAIKA